MSEFRAYPVKGKFGKYGGRFIPETLIPAIEELDKSYAKFRNDPTFRQELNLYLEDFLLETLNLQKRFEPN